MKRIVIMIISTLTITSVAAQKPTTRRIKSDSKAIAILDKAAEKINQSACSTTLKMSIKEPDSNKPTVETLEARLSGSKFYLKNKEMEVFFDGKTQWVYYPNLNEVTITTPTTKELQETSPIGFIKSYKGIYRVDFDPTVVSDKEYAIALLPHDKSNDLFRIRVFINKSTNNITKIESAFRNGQRIDIEVGSYRPIPSNSTFTFDPRQYKGISVNDMR
ncbi:MAG: hypothetical protein D8B59_07030 [Bacteroidetes bacterium]|nr:MAG: hypothetical protein D8B59_07030 [Bacteroidota bacterium]